MGEDPKPEAKEAVPSAPPRFPPGTQFGRYRIVREIGTGGMGSVYEAVLVDLNKRVALKVLAAELTHQDEYRQRFVREARAAARIRHPNVVEIFDVGVHEGLPFLAMEYLVGTDMRARFDQGPVPITELIDLIIPVIAAVVTAHDAKVIHRDLKPENIFLNQHPGQGLQPVVLDFGISKVLDEDAGLNLTATASMMGTPLYMSPEQVRGSREVDPRTDQYALAVMLYEGLTAASAFTGNSVFDLLIKKTEGEFTPLRNHKADVPAALCTAIERAMAADRDARYSSLRAFAQALLPFASEHVRALWGGALSPSAAPEPERATPTDGERADSTLRSSAKEVPAYTPPPARGFKAWHAGLALLAIGFAGFALARIAAPEKPRVNEGEHALRPASVAGGPEVAEAKAVPSVFTLRVTGIPADARFTLDGEAAGSGTLVRELPKDGKPHVLELSAAGFETKRVTFTDADAPSELVLTAVPVAPEPKPLADVAQEPKGEKRATTGKRTPKPATTPEPATTTKPTPGPRPTLTGSNESPVLY